jgi:hypothetical protein
MKLIAKTTPKNVTTKTVTRTLFSHTRGNLKGLTNENVIHSSIFKKSECFLSHKKRTRRFRYVLLIVTLIFLLIVTLICRRKKTLQ